MEIESLFGLPAHPLLVHAPVVLIPLAAFTALVALVWTGGRRPLALATVLLAWAGAVGAVLAAGAGEALQNALGEDNPLVHDHAELGESLRIIAFVFALAATVFVAVVWADRLPVAAESGIGRLLRRRGAVVGAGVLMVLLAALATGWTIQTGHSGAKAVWQEEWQQRGTHTGSPGDHDAGALRRAAPVVSAAR